MPKMTIDIYAFRNTADIYADASGNFFRSKDDKPLPTCYHNGRIAVRDGVKRYGIKRLRSNAIKTTKKIDLCPF